MLYNPEMILKLILKPIVNLLMWLAFGVSEIYERRKRRQRRRFVDRRLREKAALAKKNSPPESSGGGEA